MEPDHSHLPAFAGKARDLAALRDAVVDAANVSAGLWLSYLFVLFYLLIAVGGVTHRMLLFDDPVKLPILGVDLPLTAFFIVGPALFIVIHTYTLLHFVLLATKVGAFHTELGIQIADEGLRTRLRRQLPSNIFAQFLAGPREVREGIVGFLLRLIAWVSLVAAPLILLVLFELQFLPYQDEVITWWHRLAVVIDLILLWTLWPSISHGATTTVQWARLRHSKMLALIVASLAPVLFVFLVATFPGEWLEANVPSVQFIPQATNHGRGYNFISLHELFVGGKVNEVAGRPLSLWSNRIVLPGVDIMDNSKFDSASKIAGLSHTIVLRSRRLRGAVLVNANLPKADLSGAQLQGAFLRNARMPGADLTFANFQGADLERADLRGVKFSNTDLIGANLNFANLQFAELIGAKFQGVVLNDAMLEGAFIWGSNFSGASFRQANLNGVTAMVETAFVAADFTSAHLWRAFFHSVRIAGALSRNMVWTRTSGADYSELVAAIDEVMPSAKKDAAKKHIQRLHCEEPCDKHAEPQASTTRVQFELQSKNDTYELSLVKELSDAACMSNVGPEAAAGLVQRLLRQQEQWPYISVVAVSSVDRLLESACPALVNAWHKWRTAFLSLRGTSG